MGKTKRHVLIAFDESSELLSEYARIIGEGFPDDEFRVKRVDVEKAVFSEILASDIMVFGAASPSPKKFAELERMFKGINLAGRFAGFFVSGGEKPGVFLRKMIADTGLRTIEEDLDCDGGQKDKNNPVGGGTAVKGKKAAIGKKVRTWTTRLASLHEDWVAQHGV